VLRVYV